MRGRRTIKLLWLMGEEEKGGTKSLGQTKDFPSRKKTSTKAVAQEWEGMKYRKRRLHQTHHHHHPSNTKDGGGGVEVPEKSKLEKFAFLIATVSVSRS